MAQKLITAASIRTVELATLTDRGALDSALKIRHQLQALSKTVCIRTMLSAVLSAHPELSIAQAIATVRARVDEFATHWETLRVEYDELRSAEKLRLKPVTDAAEKRTTEIDDAIKQAALDIEMTTNGQHSRAGKVKALKDAGVSDADIERINPVEDYAGQCTKLKAAMDDLKNGRVGLRLFKHSLDTATLRKPLVVPDGGGTGL